MRIASRLTFIAALICGGWLLLPLSSFAGSLAPDCTDANPADTDPCKSCTCQYKKQTDTWYWRCSALAPGTGSCPPLSRTDTPADPTNCRGGSGCFNTPIAPTTQFQSQTTDTTPAAGFNYSDTSVFPPCTGSVPMNPSTYTTSQAQTSSTLQESAALPDINDKMASGSAPPKQCVVTSRVMCSDNTVDPTQTCKTSTQIVASIAAVCPDGYVQVGSFNMQPEVAYSQAVTYFPLTMEDYQKYSATYGYTCDGDSTLPGPKTISGNVQENQSCAQASNVEGTDDNNSDPGWNPWGYFTGKTNVMTLSGTITYNGVTKSGNFAGYLSNDTSFNSANSCYYNSPSNCANYVPSANGGCPWPNNVYYRKWTFTRHYFYCSRPAGTYFTSNSAPRSLVCARIITKYDPINKQ